MSRPQCPDRLSELCRDAGEALALRSRDPVQAEALGFQPGELQQAVQDRQALGSAVVAGIIVALADVAAQHQHPVGALVEGADHQLGRDPPGAGHADGA